MNDTTTTTTTTTPPAPPWHEGKLDAELLGHVQNKGWKIDDPVATAVEAIKGHRELQKHFGVPAEQLLKLPKDAADEAGWKTVYDRLGVPTEAKDYDLTGIKRADNTDLDQALADTIRNAAFKARVPKYRAGDFAKDIVKHLDDARAAEAAEFTAKLTAEKQTLAKNWGTTPDKLEASHQMNLAKLGAGRLGITPEAVAALEKTIGYAAVMDAMRKIGAGTSEDTFHEGGGDKKGTVMTKEGATARLAELQGDAAWRDRLLKGGAAENREFQSLTQLIAA